jgi:hypothetical protein
VSSAVVFATIQKLIKNERFRPNVSQSLDLLNGNLNTLFLNGLLPNRVPLLFGERFTTVLDDVRTGSLVRNSLFSFGKADGLFIPVKLGSLTDVAPGLFDPLKDSAASAGQP